MLSACRTVLDPTGAGLVENFLEPAETGVGYLWLIVELAGCSCSVVWGSCGLVLGIFECCCLSVGFGIWLVLVWFRGLCTVVFS